uniref:Tenascin XB n=1 Tax=Astyanax mexicanus TaxID=7994 RepID=A0A3B1KJ83_ASTMX
STDLSTGPEPPKELVFSNITETSLSVSWTKPKSIVTGFRVTYTNTGNGDNGSISVDSQLSHVLISKLSAGFSYEISVRSILGTIESEPTTASVTTGVKLQAVIPTEITFSSAVISWKAPHLAFRSYRLTYQHDRNSKEVVLNPTVTQYELTDLAAFSNYTVKVDGEREGQYINIVSSAFTTAQVPFPHPTDCSQVQLNGVTESGEVEVYPNGKDGEPAWVYCDMDTDGGGWTVFQRRVDGSTDFFRGWNDYSKGFGFLTAEFWLGNDILHSLTSLTPVTLRIDMQYGNDTAYARYSNFTVASEANHYAITLSGYSGTAGDSMSYHNGCPFSTKDKDPNPLSIHCAKAYMGGWWYKNCYKANLNGLYSTFSQNQGVVWIDWKGKDVSIPFTEMKLRPVSLKRITPQD